MLNGGDPLGADGVGFGLDFGGFGFAPDLALRFDDQVERRLVGGSERAGDEVGVVAGPDFTLLVAPGDLPAEPEVARPSGNLRVDVERVGDLVLEHRVAGGFC